MRIRKVKTASGKYALQVVSKNHGRLTVHKHIGSYANNVEKENLYRRAYDYIQKTTGQVSLFDHLNKVNLSDIAITQNKPLFVYELLSRIYNKLGLSNYPDLLIKDLIIARIYHPASKLKLQGALYESFGRFYGKRTMYRHIKEALDKGVKEKFQKALIEFARNDLKDSLKLVFYDVTTLYFESGLRVGIRDFGFSKDHRPMDTQVIVGLVVNKDGFPLYFDIFQGNTFEGHTFVSVIKGIQQLLGSTDLVVIADAAMISKDNIEKLNLEKIGFIVGARAANLPLSLIDSISPKLNSHDGKIITIPYQGQRLVCQYSARRAAKDKSDRLKQIARAEGAITNPSRITNRFRFVKADGGNMSLNKGLITKAEKLEGIKGYLTNTQLPEQTVIDRYHDLWRIENSFRITKSDLEARPIFHHLDETIKAHLVIVFAGLAISKYLEINLGMSIERILHIASKVLTHTIVNTKTGETVEKETTIEDANLKQFIERLRTLGH